MHDSVALLIAARAGLVEHEDDALAVVADLRRRFGVDQDAASAVVTAAQLLEASPRSAADISADVDLTRPAPR